MLKSFFGTRKWAFWAYGGLAVLLTTVYVQVQLLVVLNEWYKTFYDMLQKATENDISDFWLEIIRFYKIAFTYITIATVSTFFSRHYTFRWRQAMTFHYLPLWKAVERDIEGSSQRIQEDTQRFARIVESMGLELFESVLKIISFGPILWMLSSNVTIPFFADIPGSLFWVCIVVAVGGMLISYLVGYRLPGLEYNNQKVEAAFRKELVYGEDSKRIMAMPRLTDLFLGIRTNYFRLFLHYGYFDLWRIFFVQSVVLVPIMLVAPGLFTGAILLGVMVQVSNAFDRVLDGFSVLIRSWTTITELLSVIKRLREFEKALGMREGEGIAAPPVIAVKSES